VRFFPLCPLVFCDSTFRSPCPMALFEVHLDSTFSCLLELFPPHPFSSPPVQDLIVRFFHSVGSSLLSRRLSRVFSPLRVLLPSRRLSSPPVEDIELMADCGPNDSTLCTAGVFEFNHRIWRLFLPLTSGPVGEALIVPPFFSCPLPWGHFFFFQSSLFPPSPTSPERKPTALLSSMSPVGGFRLGDSSPLLEEICFFRLSFFPLPPLLFPDFLVGSATFP